MHTLDAVTMSEVKEKLKAVERKCELFKQQQFLFIAALGRSRDHAHDKNQLVSSVSQIQAYMDHHCSNTTDRHILSLFLEIVAELGGLLRLLEALLPRQTPTGSSLEACRALLNPSCDISRLQARYPHNEVNRLSCNEAGKFYGGAVSLIPLALDLLQKAVSTSTTHSMEAANSPEATPELHARSSAGNKAPSGTKQRGSSSKHPGQHLTKGMGGLHAGKPAWRPPGCVRL